MLRSVEARGDKTRHVALEGTPQCRYPPVGFVSVLVMALGGLDKGVSPTCRRPTVAGCWW
jgi:hypothetical protein